jgi:hypothetical protein
MRDPDHRSAGIAQISCPALAFVFFTPGELVAGSSRIYRFTGSASLIDRFFGFAFKLVTVGVELGQHLQRRLRLWWELHSVMVPSA